LLPLPHQPPILFAKEKLQTINETTKSVALSYEFIPTLAMLIEGASQASVVFAKENENKPKEGYVLSLHAINAYKKATSTQLQAILEQTANLGEMLRYDFSVYENEKLLADGSFVVYVPKGE